MIESLNKALKRRRRLVGTFTGGASVIRFADAASSTSMRVAGRRARYFSETPMAKLSSRDNDLADLGELVSPD